MYGKITLALWLVLLPPAGLAQQEPARRNAGDWAKALRAIRRGEHQSAVQELDRLLQTARRTGNEAEAARALCLKISYQTNPHGRHDAAEIEELQRQLQDASPLVRTILHVELANCYRRLNPQAWQRLVFDIETTGDATTPVNESLLTEQDRHLREALKSAATLKQTPLADFAAIIDPGALPYPYRPTLFDVVAYWAIEVKSLRLATALPTDRSYQALLRNPRTVGPAEDFVNWELPDEGAGPLKIYQDLLRFHSRDADRSAWLDASLHRILFVRDQLWPVNEAERQQLVQALSRFATAHRAHPISARALYEAAKLNYDAEDYAAAMVFAKQGARLHRHSIGGIACRELAERIRRPEFYMVNEREWHPNWSRLRVRYRNTREIFFRLIPVTTEECLTAGTSLPEYRSIKKQWYELLQRKPLTEWSVRLPKLENYATGVESVASLPRDMPLGPYVLLAATKPLDQAKKSDTRVTAFWRSNLTLMFLDRDSGVLEGFVCKSETGDPVVGAKVVIYSEPRESAPLERLTETATDKLGHFAVRGIDHRCTVGVFHGTDELLVDSDGAGGRNDSRIDNGQFYRYRVRFFTDRAIYRPGDPIHYKGISYRYRRSTAAFEPNAPATVTVALLDANGEEVARRTHTPNEFGSFSGTFVAPSGRLPGEYHIKALDFEQSSQQLRVEEYKRPKIRVELKRPPRRTVLKQSASVEGRATSLVGEQLAGASVQWTLTRTFYSRGFYATAGSTQSGATRADASGRFRIPVDAEVPPDVDELPALEAQYVLRVNVTDSSGETTHQELEFTIGHSWLVASIEVSDYQRSTTDVIGKVHIRSTNGEPVAGMGVDVRAYRIAQPDRPLARGDHGVELGSFGDALAAADSWPVGQLLRSIRVQTDSGGNAEVQVRLPAGLYRLVAFCRDGSATPATTRTTFVVTEPNATKFPGKMPFYCAISKTTALPGDTLMLVVGSGYETCRALVEWEHAGNVVHRQWTKAGVSQHDISIPITTAMRGGLTVRVWMVREGVLYSSEKHIAVQWPDRHLLIKRQRWVSKLTPREEVTWILSVSSASDPATPASDAELVATLYDASLDRWAKLYWADFSHVTAQQFFSVEADFSNHLLVDNYWRSRLDTPVLRRIRYPQLVIDPLERNRREGELLDDPARLLSPLEIERWREFYSGGFGGGGVLGAGGFLGAPLTTANAAFSTSIEPVIRQFGQASQETASRQSERQQPLAGDSRTPRRDRRATALFLPHLRTDDEGNVQIRFTAPEALTAWRFLAFAHDRQLRFGELQASAVTRLDFMVQPNPPRFVREGDTLWFPVKVVNLSQQPQSGTVRLHLFDSGTQVDVDSRLGNQKPELAFRLAPGKSQTLRWKLHIPRGSKGLVYRASASSSQFTDGEEGRIPVLASQTLVRDSLHIPLQRAGSSTFQWKPLLNSGESRGLEHEELVVRVISDPIWQCVLTLPPLMEYPYSCSEQLFNRLYANWIGRKILEEYPHIRKYLVQQAATLSPDARLRHHESLTQTALEETPWLGVGRSDESARQRFARLFDPQHLQNEIAGLSQQLAARCGKEGGWPWFPGGPTSEYITSYIVAGYGRAAALGIEMDTKPARRSLPLIINWLRVAQGELNRGTPAQETKLSPLEALHLYALSFYVGEEPNLTTNPTITRSLERAAVRWHQLPPYAQAHVALALHRFGKDDAARRIVQSLRSQATVDERLGMHWRARSGRYSAHYVPLETHALIMSALMEIAPDKEVLDKCRRWLLQQADSRNWRTTKSMSEVCRVLLLDGSRNTADGRPVRVWLGETEITPPQAKSQAGYYEVRVPGHKVRPEMGTIRIERPTGEDSWVELHWLHSQDISQARAAGSQSLVVEKRVTVVGNSGKETLLEQLGRPLRIGELVRVRLVVRSKQDLEFVHVKDQRGSGLEPTEVLSQYRYPSGVPAYCVTRDSSTHFFLDRLPSGQTVLEYDLRVQHAGAYAAGFAEIASMYAPQYTGRSKSVRLKIEP